MLSTSLYCIQNEKVQENHPSPLPGAFGVFYSVIAYMVIPKARKEIKQPKLNLYNLFNTLSSIRRYIHIKLFNIQTIII